VRKITKNIVGVISLGVLATSWSIGQAAETGLSLNAAPEPSNSASATPTPAASETPTPVAPAENGGTAPSPAQSPTPTPKQTATQKPTTTPTPTPTATKAAPASAATVTKTSAAISYIAKNRQGIMQLSVTKVGSKITDITIISGGTEGGEWAGIPDQLAAAAVQSQGAHFGNVTRATHTTDAFYQALDSALAKF
jgi:uncharacterized protein with FMN-binding domain